MNDIQKPLRTGEYLIYGQALKRADGWYEAHYWVDLHPEGGPRIRRVVEHQRFKKELYDTADLATAMALGAGRRWVHGEAAI